MPTGRRRSIEAIKKKLESTWGLGLSFMEEYTDLLDSYPFKFPDDDEAEEEKEAPADDYTEEMKKLQANVKKMFGKAE